MAHTILLTEQKDYSKKAINIYRSLGTVYFLPELSARQKKNIFSDVTILVVRLAHMIDASWMDAMPNLRVIATNTTGLNHIDTAEAKKRGITVISLRGRSSFLKDIPSTAEHTIALMFAVMRNIPWAFDDVKDGNWRRDMFKGNQLYKKTLGIFGFGRLAKIVTRYAKAFRMNVIAYDPYVSSKAFARARVKRVNKDTLFRTSDILSIHAALTDETKNAIQKKDLQQMKPSSYLINTARGEVIADGALLAALKKQWIAGAAIDVMHDESGDGTHLKNNSLVAYAKKHQNLIIVPHLGGATYEAMQVTEEFIAGLVDRFVKTGR